VSIPRNAKQGLAMIVLGIAVPVVFFIWSTVGYRVVYRPISLRPGHVKQTFKVNFNVSYVIGIEVERKLPNPTLDCLLGTSDFQPKGTCVDTPSVLDLRWTLSADGSPVDYGSAAKMVGGGWTAKTIEKGFISFKGERGKTYTLEMNIVKDGSKLDVTKPMLVVAIDDWDYEDMIFLPSIASLVFGVCAIVVGVLQRRPKS
jgi:hypothetical protein